MSQQNSNVESILTPTQEVLDAWEEEDYQTCSEKCLFLLKKKKGAMDSSLTAAVQRVLLQCWLNLDQYSKVDEWMQANATATSNNKGLALYAQYRLEDYEKVSKSATKESLLEQHLLAQSYFHLNQPSPALNIYKDVVANGEEAEDTQAQMEVLSNALAVLASTAVPYVSTVHATTEGNSWVEQSETFIQEHAEYSDLAFNLGILQFLEQSPTTISMNNTSNWLHHAEEHADPDDLPAIETNLAWSNHFWFHQEELEDVSYYNKHGDGLSARAAVAKLNQSLLDDTDNAPKNKKKSNNLAFPTQPHAKWNPLQLRMYWYNRAVAQYKAGKMVECLESCQSLKKTLGSGSDKQQGKKKKTKPETLWWEARAEVLVAHAQDKQTNKTAAAKLQQRLEFLKGQPSSPIVDHAVAHVQLHLHLLQQPDPSNNKKQQQQQQIRNLLLSLPESIQSTPAVKATLGAIGDVGGGDDDNDNKKKAKQNMSPEEEALSLFGKEQFKEAAALYQQTLPPPAKSNPDQLGHHLWRLQALSSSGQHEAADELWNELQSQLDTQVDFFDALDGEALEQKALPRSSTASSTKIIGADNAQAKQPKRSKESILRRRAKQKEAYLKQLEERGEYNPDRPTKPNAERWIPKHERSRARRRGQQSRGAQGGGSQADAQRLDAFARRAGNVPASSGPSTANMKVTAVGTGKRRGRR